MKQGLKHETSVVLDLGMPLSAFIIDWAAVGLMLLRGDYDIMAGAVVGGIFVILLLVSGIGYKLCNGKCPNCGKKLAK
ncbi:MAG TPA: hypothetical protein H9681_05315 [Firmicutes bacterium]|nr:hypothetical protein [Bacillota bacterium]